MSNRFAGTCYRCGKVAAPGEGMFERIGRSQRLKWPGIVGRWHVQHHACAEEYRNTAIHYKFNPAKEKQP